MEQQMVDRMQQIQLLNFLESWRHKMAMTLINRINVTSSANLTHVFSNIPQTYTDLFLTITSQSAGSGLDNVTMYLNGDSTMSNYNQILFRYTQSIGLNGAYVANSYFCSLSPGQTDWASFPGGTTVYIPNYTSSSTAKGYNIKTGTTVNSVNVASQVGLYPVQWNGTAAITSITLSGYGLYPTSNSTFSLYGIS
jgi:hypothetical protein